jgi:4a-hydroxytetrahydrobiopterin dehydratase
MTARPSRDRLDDGALSEALGALPGWSVDGDALTRTFECADFRAAVALIDRIADTAEASNHHPDLCLRRYRLLEVRLTTHDRGGITAWDVVLAHAIEVLAAED